MDVYEALKKSVVEYDVKGAAGWAHKGGRGLDRRSP
jgi:hypothetical protein